MTAREFLTRWSAGELPSKPRRRDLRRYVRDLLATLEAAEYENAIRAQLVTANRRLIRERDAEARLRKQLVIENHRLRAEHAEAQAVLTGLRSALQKVAE